MHLIQFKPPQPNAINWMVYKQWKSLFLIVLETGSLDQGASVAVVLTRVFWLQVRLCVVLSWQEESKLPPSPFDEGTNPIHESSTLII